MMEMVKMEMIEFWDHVLQASNFGLNTTMDSLEQIRKTPPGPMKLSVVGWVVYENKSWLVMSFEHQKGPAYPWSGNESLLFSTFFVIIKSTIISRHQVEVKDEEPPVSKG